MATNDAKNLIERLEHRAALAEHPSVREMLSNIIVHSTPNHPEQQSFLKTPGSFVQKRTSVFVQIAENMHLLNDEEKEYVRDFIRGAYFYDEKIPNTGRIKQITKTVLERIVTTLGLPKLVEAMHHFDSLDKIDLFMTNNMFPHHVRVAYNQLKAAQQKTSATTLDDDTKIELEFRLTAFVMRRDSAKSEDEKLFYNVLAGLVNLKLHPEEYPDLTQKEINVVAAGIIKNLEESRQDFSDQGLIDAQSVIREVLFPLSFPTSYFVVNDETYDAIDPDRLFRVAYLYGVHETLDNRIDALPEKFSSVYTQWTLANEGFIEGILKQQLDSLVGQRQPTEESVPEGYKQLAETAESEGVRQLYKGLVEAFSIPNSVSPQNKVRAVQKMYPQIVKTAIDEHGNLSEDDIAAVRDFLNAKIFFLSNPVVLNTLEKLKPESLRKERFKTSRFESQTAYSAIPSHDLFKVAYLYGLQDLLDAEIRKKNVPPAVRKSYDAWKASNASFIAACLVDPLKNIPAVNEKSEDPAYLKNPQDILPYYRAQISRAHNDATKKFYKLLIEFENLRVSPPTGRREKDSVEISRKILLLVAENFGEFEADVHQDIQVSIEPLFAPINDFEGNSKRNTQKLLREIPPYTLARMVHAFGLRKKLEEASTIGLVTADLKSKFDAWTEKNAEFVADCEVANHDIPHIGAIIRARNATEDMLTKKFYESCKAFYAYLLPKGFAKLIDDKIVPVEEFYAAMSTDVGKLKYLSANWNLADEEIKTIIKPIAFAAIALVESDEENLSKHPLNVLPAAEVFAFAKLTSIEERLKMVIDSGKFPHLKSTDYDRWLADPEGFVSPVFLSAASVAANDGIPPEGHSPFDAVVRYHEVHHPIVIRRNREDGMGVRAVDEVDQIDASSSQNDADLQRTKKLSDALKINSATKIEAIDVYWNVSQESQKDGKPYNLISIKLRDGTTTNIAVCDYVGNMTLVERNASQYDDASTLDREDMRKKPTTWSVVHFNDDQWIQGVKEILYADLNDLSPALKSRSYWYSLSDVSVQTLTTKFMIAGRAPATVLTTNLIDCGPLEGRSKFNLLYAAWNRGSIEGWMKGTTFTLVLDALVNGKVTNALRIEQGKYVFNEGEVTQRETPSMPWLKKFENKPQITSDSIIQASERFRREFGEAVDRDFFEFLMIDEVDVRVDLNAPDLRRTGIEADMAFKFKAVSIPNQKVQEWGRYPAGLEDFLELSGIVQSLPQRSVA